MNGQISQDEINAILWRACDTFRGTVDPAEYKNYILVMLFVKYISDAWRDHYDAYRAQLGDDEARVRRRMGFEKFKLPEGADFPALHAQRNAPNLGEVINIALEAIENANKEKLEGVFRNIDFNSEAALGRTKQRNERLQHLLNDFADPQARPAALPHRQPGHHRRRLRVPDRQVRRGRGQEGRRVLHPARGLDAVGEAGGAPAARADRRPRVRLRLAADQVRPRGGQHDYALYGQENNGATWALAKMNMFLHDVSNARIDWGDTLKEPTLLEGDALMRFNVVVANFPFSLDKWGAEGAAKDRYRRFWRGIPPKSAGDYAFITHMIETTYTDPAQNGRVGVIAPHGVLFPRRRGGADPPQAGGGEPAGRGDRPAAQSFLRHGHPRGAS